MSSDKNKYFLYCTVRQCRNEREIQLLLAMMLEGHIKNVFCSSKSFHSKPILDLIYLNYYPDQIICRVDNNLSYVPKEALLRNLEEEKYFRIYLRTALTMPSLRTTPVSQGTLANSPLRTISNGSLLRKGRSPVSSITGRYAVSGSTDQNCKHIKIKRYNPLRSQKRRCNVLYQVKKKNL